MYDGIGRHYACDFKQNVTGFCALGDCTNHFTPDYVSLQDFTPNLFDQIVRKSSDFYPGLIEFNDRKTTFQTARTGSSESQPEVAVDAGTLFGIPAVEAAEDDEKATMTGVFICFILAGLNWFGNPSSERICHQRRRKTHHSLRALESECLHRIRRC